MVEHIKHFCSELQLERFVNQKVAMHSQIPLGCTKTSESISRKIALAYGISRGWVNGRINKSCWIKSSPSRTSRTECRQAPRSRHIKRLSRNNIGANICENVAVEFEKIDVGEIYRHRRSSQDEGLQ